VAKKTCREDKWATAFGLGHYSREVRCLPADQKGKVWGRSHYNHQEEWFEVEVVPDGALPTEQVEALVLHELAHGLLSFANEGDSAVEAVCNRISKLASRQRKPLVHCNQYAGMGPDGWEEARLNSLRSNELHFDADPWLSTLVDSLPKKESSVVSALYYEKASLREVARRHGVSARTVGRWRDDGLAMLRVALRKLDR